MLDQSCDIESAKLATLREGILISLIKYLRDSRKADADILEDRTLRDVLGGLVNKLENSFYLSINSSSECAGAKNAIILMEDSSSFQVFKDRVEASLQKNSQLIDEWLITNLYMNKNPNVDWFIDEGLAFTIFQDAIVIRTIIDSSYHPKMADLLQLFSQSIDLSKQFIEYAINNKLVNPLTPGLEATALPEVRNYLKRLVAYPMFRNQEISNITNMDTLYRDLNLPKSLKSKEAKVDQEIQTKNKTITYLSIATVMLGLGCIYLARRKVDSSSRTTYVDRYADDDFPRSYAQTNIPALK
jgi:hypothetical protein